jgi:GPI ethanolamine phosphate transferase 2/3 subunit F
MPSRKNKNRKAATAPNVPTQFTENDGTSFFPFASYVSVVGVHTTLLAFVSLFLVRTPQALPRSPTPLPFLEALTRDPVSTVAWICAGVIPLQGWWAGWVRKWWIEFYMKGTDTEKKLEWNVRDKGKFSVNFSFHFDSWSLTKGPVGSGKCLVEYCCNLVGGLRRRSAFWRSVT